MFPRDVDAHAPTCTGFRSGFIADRARRVRGFQFGIGWAQTDEELRGMQLAAAASLAQGRVRGFQLTGGANILRGEGRGFQLTGGANVVDGSYYGFQLAGGANVATASMRGFQLTGGANVANEARGLQVAGGANLAQNMTRRAARPVNVAEEMRGTQLGVVNTAVNASGVRIGVVNVAKRSKGFQLGVINVAEHDDGESFALLNLVGNGIHDGTVFATDVMATNIGVKLGGRHLYTHLSAGYQPGDALAAGPEVFTRGTRRWGVGGGLGWRFPIERGPLAYLELEAGTTQLRSSLELGRARRRTCRRCARRWACGWRATWWRSPAPASTSPSGPTAPTPAWAGDRSSSGPKARPTVRVYPGLLLGLQI